MMNITIEEWQEMNQQLDSQSIKLERQENEIKILKEQVETLLKRIDDLSAIKATDLTNSATETKSISDESETFILLNMYIFVKIVISVWLLLSTCVSPWLCCLESLRTAQQETLRVSMESAANYGNKFTKVSGLISIHLIYFII